MGFGDSVTLNHQTSYLFQIVLSHIYQINFLVGFNLSFRYVHHVLNLTYKEIVMTIELTYLTKHPQHIKQLAEWYFDEWGEYVENSSAIAFQEKLKAYLNIDSIPLIILAVEGDTLVGAVQIKYREMTIYPDKEYWLGGVYVNPSYRGQFIASQLILQAEKQAIELNISHLHLQTESLNGGLYAKLGWEIETQVNYRGVDVAVMEKVLNQEN